MSKKALVIILAGDHGAWTRVIGVDAVISEDFLNVF